MEKRLIVAIALSLLVLLSWSAMVSKTQPVANKEVASKITEDTAVQAPAYSPVLAPAPSTPAEAEPIALSKLLLERTEVTLNDSKASIKEVAFKKHQLSRFKLERAFVLDDKSLHFQKESEDATSATFVHIDETKKVTKKITFSNNNYDIGLEINIRNLSTSPLEFSAPLIVGALFFAPQDADSRYQDVAISTKEKTQHVNAQKNLQISNIEFLGLRDRYFCLIVQPEQPNYLAYVKKISNQESEIGLIPEKTIIAPGSQIGHKFKAYLGPQDVKLINAANSNWAIIINYGTFDFIAQLLLQLLAFLFSLVKNWGLAIIVLSIVVYYALYPLSLKQMRSMKDMQALQPKIEALRKAYKDNPQKLNKEIMQLYKDHKVNPLGGCLPLVLQMPIFFALYQALMRSIALKGASFLWIKDLSQPDRLFVMKNSIPLLGNEINILPIVMALGMFFQQKISMVNTPSSSTNEQQKMMLIFMPIMFGFIFYHMPSGLVLYWFVNSGLMLINQLKLYRAK